MTPGRGADTARERAWVLLSDFYLDTDPALFQDRCARELAALPFDEAELERIFREEVHPALRAQLYQVTGEWVGFDPDWIVRTVRRRLARPRWLRFGGQRDWQLVAPSWEAVRQRLRAFRGGDGSPRSTPEAEA